MRQALSGDASEGLLPSDRPDGALAVSASPILGAGSAAMAMVQVRASDSGGVPLGVGLQPVLDSLRSLLGSDLAALAFYDNHTREISWQVTSGATSPRVAGIRLRPGQGFAGRILLRGLPLATFRFPQDLTDAPDCYPILVAEGLKAAVGVPVRGKERVLGVLMVASRRERTYTDGDIAKLTQVADSLSLAAELMVLHTEALRRERAKLAQEVHDGLSQNLFGLKLLLGDLRQERNLADRTAKGLSDVCQLLDETVGEVRSLIADLRGTSRTPTGLIGALSDYLTQFCKLSDLQVELVVRLGVGEEICCADVHEVLRIVQEALMNVHRHAAARWVRVEIDRQGACYRIAVADDGKGFDGAAAVPDGHFGIAIMQERAIRLGGELQIESGAGKGTVVTLRLPV